MSIRNMTIPFFGGGALIVGYALFSRWRAKRAAHESQVPLETQESRPGPAHREKASPNEAREDTGPWSERSPRVSDILELAAFDALEPLELGPLAPIDNLTSECQPSVHEAVAPEDIGALFLARATDALSPFGSHAGQPQFELDQFEFESGFVSEATARAANGGEEIDRGPRERSAESERRPSPQRTRGGR